MRWRNSTEAYGIIAQSFHWFIAALVFTQIGIGLYVHDLPLSLTRLRWIARHKSIGILILTLFLLRLAWRRFDRAPPLPAFMAPTEQRLAVGTHRLLYALAISAALAGWIHASAAGLNPSFFGLFPIPALVSKNVGLSDAFETIHAWLVWTLAAVLVLHMAGAVRHLWRRDGVFGRMFPGSSARP